MLNNITYCRIGIAPSANSIMYANYIANNEWTINSRNAIINPNGNLNFLTHNNFVNNHYYTVQTLVMPNNTMDYFDNGVVGNYWDIYQGVDNNFDGIGDSPFYLDSNDLDRFPLIAPFDFSTVEEVFPDWLIMPSIDVVSPKSVTYSTANVSVDFVLNKQMSWVGYSLDGIENRTVTGNLTLRDLSFGAHNLTVYAIDGYGNQVASQTISFTIEEPFPTLLIATVSIFTVFISLIGILLFRRHQKTTLSRNLDKPVSQETLTKTFILQTPHSLRIAMLNRTVASVFIIAFLITPIGAVSIDFAQANPYLHEDHWTEVPPPAGTAPIITIYTPQNGLYYQKNVNLTLDVIIPKTNGTYSISELYYVGSWKPNEVTYIAKKFGVNTSFSVDLTAVPGGNLSIALYAVGEGFYVTSQELGSNTYTMITHFATFKMTSHSTVSFIKDLVPPRIPFNPPKTQLTTAKC